MANKRDDFSPNTKRIMAERVAWRCSYPNCSQITIGPDSSNANKKINNGIAAHIHAAAENGPRYDPDMTSEQRKDINNGIWMCRNHGNLIDADSSQFPANTLRIWKYKAERIAAENLKIPNNNYSENATTLLQIGSQIIFNAEWESVSANEWQFKLEEAVIGDLNLLTKYILSFKPNEGESFIIVESQGDARIISDINLKSSILSLNVNDKLTATNPNLLGRDYARSDENKWVEVKGKDTAINLVKNCLSIIKGGIAHDPEFGSLATEYYHKYKENTALLSRLLKLEMVRLSLIPIHGSLFHKDNKQAPPLLFVERFLDVNVKSNELVDSRLRVDVSLEWGNNEKWSGTIQVLIMNEAEYINMREQFTNNALKAYQLCNNLPISTDEGVNKSV